MRIVNANGRLSLAFEDGILDVESASNGQFSADVQSVYDHWAEFRRWARDRSGSALSPLPVDTLGAPVPRPRQVFGIGLNYREHALEAGMELPTTSLTVFTKFPSSITGPQATIELPSDSVDFETELVVVLGRRAHRIPEDQAWDCVAGLTMGQDLSEREVQLAGPAPQFNLGKSFPGFTPIGPALVTPDEFADPDDIEIGCLLGGEQLQKTRTNDLIFSISRTIAFLSSIVALYPGDVIFTGTPSGTGWAREPQRLLRVGDELVTYGETIGSMRNRFTAGH